MAVYLNIIQIIVSIGLIILLMLQSKGGGLSRMFGSEASVYRTRRGVERTVFNLTIALIVIFVVVSVVSALVGR